MTPPIWFLDIDGVVNAAGVDLPAHLIQTEATTQGVTWPINYSPDVVEVINTINRAGLAEVRWLTTWGEDARSSLAPAVGLDDFAAYDMYDSDDWWKAEIVAASITEEKRPLVWTDDDITDLNITYFQDKVDLPSLLVSPTTELGLLSDDLRRIADFLSTIKQAEGQHD